MKRIFTSLMLTFCFSLCGFSQITWTKKTGPYGGYIGDIVVHPTNFTLYALSSQYNNGGPLYRSTDNGATWTELGISVFSGDAGHFVDILMLSNGTLYALSYYQCCASNAGNNLYKSLDDGATWTKLNSGNGSAAGGFDYPTQVAYNNFSHTIYVFGQDSGSPFNNRVYRSLDGGATFSKGFGDLSGNFTNISITSTGDVYALHSNTLFKSTDDGTTFTNVGTPDTYSVAYIACKSDGSELVMVTTGSNMYALSTPFTTWNLILETGITVTDQTSYGSQAVLGYSLDNSVLYLQDNVHNKFYSGSSAGTWTSKSTTFVNSSGDNGICFAAKDANTLYVGTSDIGVWKTINGGSGWNETDKGIEGSNFSSIVAADNGNVIVAGTRAQISTDQGATWTRITTIANNGPNYSLFKAPTGSPATIVAVSQGASYKSTDNGATWSATTSGPSGAYMYASTDGVNIAGRGNSQFFYSHDQSTTWSAALTISGTGWPSGSFSINYFAVDGTNGVIYCYLYDNGTYKLFKITLNSTTAPTSGTATLINQTLIGTINQINAIAFLNGKLYVSWYGNSGPGNISFSSDGGTTWTTTSGVNSGRMDVDPVNNYLFVTGSNGNSNYTINLTRDGGTTFTSSSINTSSNSNFYGIALSASGIAYAGLTNSSIYGTTGTVVTPIAPTSLVSSGTGTDRITVRWIDNATNEDHFIVEKFNGTSYDSVGYANSNSTTGAKVYAEIRNLQANTSYTFRVTAKNAAGTTSSANLVFTTLMQCATTIPDNRSWNGNVATSTPATATLSNISIKSLGNGFFSITDIVNGTISGQNTNIPGIFFESCGSTYLNPNNPTQPNTDGTWNGTTLTLKWITGNGITPEITATVTLTLAGADPIPAAPSSPSAYVYNNTSIEVTWIGSAFETQYIVERSLSNTFGTIDRTITVNYPSTSVVDNTGLANGTTYYYRVKAKNNAGTSSPSSTFATITLTQPYFTLSGTTIESTLAYSTTGPIWGDFNNDGFDDVIMPQLTFFQATPSLPLAFKNDGAGNFVSVAPAGITPSTYVVATAADYDNDGKLDLFLTSSSSQNYLYKGNGDFTFALVGSTPVSTNYNTGASLVLDLGASWGDYNNDGLVDLFVATNDNTKKSKLFTQGPVGTFTLATSGGLQSVMVQGSIANWADYDNDGDQDIFIVDSNGSLSVNQLYKNNGNGTFTRVTGAPFDTDVNERSFTAAWGDYNNDTNLDLFIGAQSNNLLYKNNGNGTFTKQSLPTSVTENLTNSSDQTFGAAWGDINNDGFQDLLVTVVGEESRIYINNNGTSFTKVNTEKFNDIKVPRFGMGFSDYNKDGLLDLASAVIDPALFGKGFVSGPTVKNQLFKNNASSAGNWVELKLTGTTSNKLGIGTRVTLVAGGKTQIRELASTSAFCSQNSQTIHFGLGSATSITSIQIKWPSGIVQTLTAPATNQLLQITEDGTPPQVTLYNPLNNALNVAVSTPIEITFNKAFVAVAGKKINVTIQGSTSPEFSLDVSTGIIVGNKISFTPPALGILNTYVVQVDAGAFADTYGIATSAIISWTFTTLDNIPPVITFTPPQLSRNFVSTQFAVTATDNSGTVSSATLSYRPIGGGNFTDLPGTFDAVNVVWNFTVKESFLDANGLEFYLTAKDQSNNIGRLPLDLNTNFYSYLSYKTADNVVPSAQIGFGGTISGWKIFTIPFDYGSNNAVSTVLAQLLTLPTDKTAWRMLTYKDNTAWAEYPGDFSTVIRGQGYFINIKTPLSLKIPDATVSANNRKTLYQMALKKGWNQVGNPYLTPINWSDVVTFNTLSGAAVQLKTYTGNYTNATSLQPFEGGFVLADNDATISIPFSGQTAIGGRQEKLTFGDNDWLMPLTLKNGDVENNFGGVGMHSQALFSYDQFDDVNAPRFINYLEMNFPHPEYFTKQFARDVVPTQSEYLWQFTFNGNMEGVTQMTWENANLGANTKEIFLYDIGSEVLVNMREQSGYSIDPKKATVFKIYYGDNLKDKIKPDNITLGEAYPNPSRGNVTIPFTLPDNQSNYKVALEVYNNMGQKVSTLADGFYNPGFYSSRWETSQTTLSNGLYIYCLKVSDQNRSVVLSGKIVINQ
jgi:hypothetical protein